MHSVWGRRASADATRRECMRAVNPVYVRATTWPKSPSAGHNRATMRSSSAGTVAATTLCRATGRRGRCWFSARLGANRLRCLVHHDDYPVKKTDAEWRAQLDRWTTRSPARQRPSILSRGAIGTTLKNGRYRCVCCGVDLFESDTKFDAGCGWPSFWRSADADRIERLCDTSHGMIRVEVRCHNCGAHLGHVFDDGPPAYGGVGCINSAALDFTPDET